MLRPLFSPVFPSFPALEYIVYNPMLDFLWKTQWKKWKTSWENRDFFHNSGGKPSGKSGKPHGKLALFFTKTVENPVEKVKSSFQTGNSIHFPVVLLCRKIRLTAVFLGGRCGSFPHCGIALNAPANHGTITAEKCGKTHRYRNTMRWRHPI